MWSDAQRAVAVISTMPVRLLSESIIETFPPNGPGKMGAIVRKVPEPSGYRVEVRLDCFDRRSSGCADFQQAGMQLFESMMGAR